MAAERLLHPVVGAAVTAIRQADRTRNAREEKS
jgi:hypothetical protein